MPLHIGEQCPFDGAMGRVVALTDSTDANGRGSVSYGGASFSFRALKGTVAGTDYPLVATSDAVFRVGVVQQHADPTLFCLVLDDDPAPWGWGRRVAGKSGAWAAASEYAAQDSVVFIMGWVPGTITIEDGGVPQSGVYADLVLTYSTRDGEHRCWWGPAYPSGTSSMWEGAGEGRFLTDANGVLWDYSDGTKQPVIIPCGFGALGYRAADAWSGAPTAERLLTKLEVWYHQEHAEVSEATNTTLDIGGGTVTVTGPPNAAVELWWEEGPYVGSCVDLVLDGSGNGVGTGLGPGTYTACCLHKTDPNKGLPRQTFSMTQGGTATLDFPSTWQSATAPQIAGVIYETPHTPYAGAVVWQHVVPFDPPGAYWEVLTTADGNGAFGPIQPDAFADAIMVEHPDYGAAWCYLPAALIGWWSPCLGARIGALASMDVAPSEQGLEPWGKGGAHENLPAPVIPAYLISSEDTRYELHQTDDEGGYVSDYCPRLRVERVTDGVDSTEVTYTVYDMDGTVIDTVSMDADIGPLWTGKATPPWDQTDYSNSGGRIEATVGGKIDGNVVEASRGDRITVENLTEAARMGLETGKLTQPLEVRFASALHPSPEGEGNDMTFTGWECPYCGGPAHMGPDTADGLKRGYCIPCWLIGGTYVDCRTYFLSPTLATYDDWQVRVVKNTTAGGYVDRLVTGWPRPAEYYETDDYLVDPWVDGLPRWVATHIVLGSLAGGVFTDGESVADAETRVGDTIGPVQLKLLLRADYQGTGKTVRVTATNAYTGDTDILTATVPQDAVADDIVLLKWGPHDGYPGYGNWYTDVLNAVEVSGDGYLSCRVVNDGPSWRSSAGVIVRNQLYSPWACDVPLGARQPFLVEDFAGRLHLVYLREGRLMHRVLTGTDEAWSDPTDVTLRADWPHPCEEPSLAPLPHAELLVAAHSQGATRLWRTQDDGERWG